ncbi:RagB/SusD family nutrient uptake outer membrane protein [Larkinella bovis]|uniref:RagB/SusD family nutrient uptake outer membrane protein n=1 Tax=Larkinella bovis TaxID=683041 RepID=A0ABW0I8V7_9BACT
MKRILSTICVGLLLGSTACENFLKEEPVSAISSENFYKTPADAQAGVNAVYTALSGYYGSNAWYFGDVTTEIANRGELTGGLDVLDYTPADPVFRDFWTVMYRGINYANVAIKLVPGISMEETLRKRYVAEARFLRGLFYFDLVRAFGPVPKISEPTMDDSNNRLPRASVEEIYALILEDLKAAETDLPATYASADVGRATKGAAQALLAKVYLTKGDWKNARDKAQEVIASNRYSLFPNFRDVFKVQNENGREHIFSVQFKSGNNRGGGSSFTSQFASRNPNILLNGAIAGTSIAAERPFYASFPNHYRKQISMVETFPSTYYPEITARGIAQAGPACMKYWDPAFGLTQGGDANWMVLRYADVLLMFAEAENELSGPTAAAYEAINQVRKRARDENANGVSEPAETALLPDLTGLTKDTFRLAVWEERRMELCFEGHHRWDLLRTGRFIDALKASGRTAEQKHLLFPIPDLEISANPALTQNAGYPQ